MIANQLLFNFCLIPLKVIVAVGLMCINLITVDLKYIFWLSVSLKLSWCTNTGNG